MLYSPLGCTGIRVSRIAFGAGPVAGLMTAHQPARQQELIERALAVGINWFDTAATYGDGQSEKSIGAALNSTGAVQVHVATKVRLAPEHLDDIVGHVRSSVAGSLQRLGLEKITLLQIHNAITANRGDEPTSITPRDVLGSKGVLEAMQLLRDEGLIEHLGITAIGQAGALREVLRSGAFATIQGPFNLVNPSAGQEVAAKFQEANYGNIIDLCAQQQIGVFAIRVFAGGALADNPPSAHTHKTKFFPLELYHRDKARAENIKASLPKGMTLKELAVRFTLSHPGVTSAIIGFGETEHIDEAVKYLKAGPLPPELLDQLPQAT